MSQPSRAVFAFCLFNKIPHKVREIQISALEHLDKEFKKVNPNGKVPAITDEGLNLFESHAILRYLATSKKCEDNWYPKDLKLRAKVDEYLDWHHQNIRHGAEGYFVKTCLQALSGKPASKEAI